MTYGALTVGLADKLFSILQALVTRYDLHLTASSTVWEAGQMLVQQTYHLLIVDLDYLRQIRQVEWLDGIRNVSRIPVIVLSGTPERDVNNMVLLGADMCISGKRPHAMIADHAYAQLRRYTQYNQDRLAADTENAPLRVGDIYIDPARRIVEVCGQPVSLRPREFSLLLYFMQNPDIVLTAEKICEKAWKMDYTQPVGQSVHELRKQIEANTGQSCYIKTIYRVGYQFTGYSSETCDD